jgi:hypothetical protein
VITAKVLEKLFVRVVMGKEKLNALTAKVRDAVNVTELGILPARNVLGHNT